MNARNKYNYDIYAENCTSAQNLMVVNKLIRVSEAHRKADVQKLAFT